MYRKVSIIISIILVTAAAILTVQSSSLSMLQSSYAQLCADGSTPDASGNCPTDVPPADDGETAQAPPPTTTETPPPATTETPPPTTTELPPPATAPPTTTETPPPATAPPAGASQGSNNTGGMSADRINTILTVFNSERAAVGVPPYVWNDALAAQVQGWVDYIAAGKTGGRLGHCDYFPGWQQIPECAHFEESGEGLAAIYGAVVEPPALIDLWKAEKPGGHYLGLVSAEWKSFGCGYATTTTLIDAEGKPISVASILGCRYQ